MSKKIVIFIVGIVVAFLLVMGVRHKLGIKPIKSAVGEYEKIDIEILIKDTESSERNYPLTGESVVSGEIDVKGKFQDESDEFTYVEYKINGAHYVTGYAPSFGVTIDTGDLPDGWNQLLVFGYKESDKLEGIEQVIFKVENNKELEARAPRLDKVYKVGEGPSYKKEYIPVLMYHDFREEITKEQESAVVHPDLFERQLEALVENEYTPINFNDLYLYIKGKGGLPSKPIIITADDGYLSNYEIAFPILKKYNMPATFFVTSKYVGVETGLPHFTWDQAKEMEESGLIDIQSHTYGHELLNTLPDDEVRYQVDYSFNLIQQNLGKRDVKVLAYPQFYNNSHTRDVLAGEGVDLQVTNLAKRFKPTTKATNIQRIHVSNNTSPEDLIRKIKGLTR